MYANLLKYFLGNLLIGNEMATLKNDNGVRQSLCV